MIVATNLTENMEERVKELLNRILHPETQHGLVESGFVEQVSTPGDKITVTLNFAKVRDPFALKIKRQVQALLEENFPALKGSITVIIKEAAPKKPQAADKPTMTGDIAHIVAIASGKGGVGKSTVTALAASYLHNVQGHNVAVIDCDAPQHSIHGLRERETKLIDESLYFKALACDHFRKIKKNAYPVIASDALNALDDAERMLAEEDAKPNIVFFDMPGTLKSNGVVKTLSQMDYIFAPMSADRFVVESTLQFAVMFRDNLMTTGQAKTKGLYLFWTMVDGREKNGLYDVYEDVIADMGLSILSTRLPDSKKFRRDLSEERKSVFRSTIFPTEASLLKGSGIREFSEEICKIITGR